jgi:phosphatidylserine/phosphatidylglycerophosphate/cardiolipin synthase-like enzyme
MDFKAFTQRFLLSALFCLIVGFFFYIAYKINEWQSPAYQTAQVLLDENSRINRALFAPDDNVQELLVTLINEEKEQILAAAYSFTDEDIAYALIDAHKRGVNVQIIADGSNSITAHSKVPLLIKHQVPVWIYPSVKSDKAHQTPIGIMHNKFMIFKKSLLNRSILWTGSFNFTRSAQTRNQENIVVLDSPKLIERYRKQFERIKKRCIKNS